MSLEVLVDNETLLAGLERKAGELPEQLRRLTNEAAFIVDAHVKQEVPVQTGNLQGSISIDNVSDYVKRIYPDEGIAPYAIYVIKETPPHEIWAAPGSALNTPYGLFRKVNHPGTAANDFMGRGFEAAQDDIESAVDEFKSWLLD